MFNHPLTLTGLCIAAAGWAFLLFGVGVDTGRGFGAIANLHLVSIADSVIITGCAVFVAGIIIDCASKIITEMNSIERKIGAPRKPKMIPLGSSRSAQ
ncbi:hypothetical protein [Aurantimonas sp. 22II-16-19i]|uniref:hypothetical protein n=1 Tax=Aurantimonas sp. 22II-16-19i TaxID=1317114 RepID=UPI00111BF1BA|nr:hypothetical protein [Aurantimonas sp. 22II-16-19i]